MGDTPQIEPPRPMSLSQLLFSFSGRIPRGKFWALFGSMFVLMVLVVSVQGLLEYGAHNGSAAGFVFASSVVLFLGLFLLIWVSIATQAKRWHDLDRSAWMILLGLIPIVSLFVFLYLGIGKGTTGKNRFGPDPLGSQAPLPVDPAAPPQTKPGTKKSAQLIAIGVGLAVLLAFVLALGIPIIAKSFHRAHAEAQTTVARLFVGQDARTALTLYSLDIGGFPSTAEGLGALVKAPADKATRWRGPYLRGGAIPRDPWGREFKYLCPGIHNKDDYDVWSTGPDGIDSAADNIGNW